MAAYFTESQTRVLRSAWICIIPLALQTLIVRYGKIENSLVFNGTYILASMFLVCWEFLYARDWKKAGILAATSAGIFGLTVLAYYLFKIPAAGPARPFLAIHIFTLINFLITFCMRCYLAGNQRFIVTGVIVALIKHYGLSGALFGLLASNQAFINFIVGIEHAVAAYGLVFYIVYPFAYYMALYLAENYFNREGFVSVFHSKMQVTGGREYAMLNIVLMTLIVNSATNAPRCLRLIRDYFSSLPETTYYPPLGSSILFPNIMEIAVQVMLILICGYLLRNVIVARMTTTGSRNGILYLLHYVPLLNIIPLVVYSSRKEEHSNAADNALYYTLREASRLRTWIVLAGVLAAMYSAFMTFALLSNSRGTGTNAEELVMVLIILAGLVRIVAYLLMFNYRKAVFAIVFFNFFFILFSFSKGFELTGLELALTYLSVYFLLEIFHPALSPSDAEAMDQGFSAGTEAP